MRWEDILGRNEGCLCRRRSDFRHMFPSRQSPVEAPTESTQAGSQIADPPPYGKIALRSSQHRR